MDARFVMTVLLAGATTVAAETVELPARTLERDGVRVTFPTVVYDAPEVRLPVTPVCARLASQALGVEVDPVRDRLAETKHRVVFRDPSDPGWVLKLYRPDVYDAPRVAKMLQRDLAVQALLVSQGLRVASFDPNPRLLALGVERQPFVTGKGLDDAYPEGYRTGTDPAVDRMLAKVAVMDAPLRAMVSLQSGLVFTNTVDCHSERPLGVDLGHCYANIVLEAATGTPIFVDW